MIDSFIQNPFVGSQTRTELRAGGLRAAARRCAPSAVGLWGGVSGGHRVSSCQAAPRVAKKGPCAPRGAGSRAGSRSWPRPSATATQRTRRGTVLPLRSHLAAREGYSAGTGKETRGREGSREAEGRTWAGGRLGQAATQTWRRGDHVFPGSRWGGPGRPRDVQRIGREPRRQPGGAVGRWRAPQHFGDRRRPSESPVSLSVALKHSSSVIEFFFPQVV